MLSWPQNYIPVVIDRKCIAFCYFWAEACARPTYPVVLLYALKGRGQNYRKAPSASKPDKRHLRMFPHDSKVQQHVINFSVYAHNVMIGDNGRKTRVRSGARSTAATTSWACAWTCRHRRMRMNGYELQFTLKICTVLETHVPGVACDAESIKEAPFTLAKKHAFERLCVMSKLCVK